VRKGREGSRRGKRGRIGKGEKEEERESGGGTKNVIKDYYTCKIIKYSKTSLLLYCSRI
jgi:hypothetical protein